SPLARRPYDLRHAAASLWLNAGVPPTEVARRLGHSVAVLLKVYANCIDGGEDGVNDRIGERSDDHLGRRSLSRSRSLRRSHARGAGPDAGGQALDQVDDAFDERKPDEDPIWVYWLNRDEIEVMQGRVWTQLQRPLRAVPALEHAVAAYGDDVPWETALYLT